MYNDLDKIYCKNNLVINFRNFKKSWFLIIKINNKIYRINFWYPRIYWTRNLEDYNLIPENILIENNSKIKICKNVIEFIENNLNYRLFHSY